MLNHDIQRMLNFLTSEENIEAWILNIPTELSIGEGNELKESLENGNIKNIKFILNNVMCKNQEITKLELPEFILKKINIEKEIIKTNKNSFDLFFPMSLDQSSIGPIGIIEESINLNDLK